MGGTKRKGEFVLFVLLLLPLVLQVCFNSKLLQVRAGSRIDFLPGFDGELPFHLETGYIGVGESEDVQLFYYFIKSQSNPEMDPLVLWITGGPGCSSISGLVYEIGPFTFEPVEYNGSLPRLVLKPYSWTEVASIIFLDWPVGTGFSYAITPKALESTTLPAADQIYQFLRKFLIDHREHLSNPFYIGGDSYSGRPVPITAQLISDGNGHGNQLWIDLKGYLLGNPTTTPLDSNSRVQFAHGMGLIPDELHESLIRNCKGMFVTIDPENFLCMKDMQTFNQLVENIKFSHILEYYCGLRAPNPQNTYAERRDLDETSQELSGHDLLRAVKCREQAFVLAEIWANDQSVREALDIPKGKVGYWHRCNDNLLYTETIHSSMPYHANLSTLGYRSLIYSGDHDMVVPHFGTQDWIRSLNYSIVDEWRPWLVEGQVAGYTRTYANRMTFATVKGAGHTAPEYKPAECRAMFERWISYEPL